MKIMHSMMYVLLGATLTLISCVKKDIEHIPLVGEIEIPDGFDWTTTQSVALSMTAPGESNVSIYLDEQCSDSKLIAKLPVSSEQMTYDLEVPTTSNAIYLQYTKANGEKEVVKKSLESSRGLSRGYLEDQEQLKVIHTFADLIWAPNEMNGYRPSQGQYGTLMFEDTWPNKGDYDFNDFVVNYNVQMETQGNTSTLTLSFKIRAIGGTLPYRFCFQVSSSSMSSLKFTKEDFLKCTFAQESNRDGCKIEMLEGIADNEPVAFVITGLDGLKSGEFYNTDPESLNSNKTVTVSCTLTAPKSSYQKAFYAATMGQNAINYFIQNPKNKMEIHMAGYYPTSLFTDYATIATKDLVDQKAFYYSNDNYVWVLMVPEEISWASEKTNFLIAYPNFSDWLIKGGDTYSVGSSSKTWYNFPSTKENMIIDHTKH